MLAPRGVDASAGPITLPVTAALSAVRCWLWGGSVFVLPLVQFSMSPDSQRSSKRDGGVGAMPVGTAHRQSSP